MMKNLRELLFNRNLPMRLIFGILIIIPLLFYQDFWIHIHAHFSGSILDNIITNQWHIVIINIVVFISFLIPLSFRRKIDWKEYGLITAFFVSLFVEMYGIPLTVFFAAETLSGGATEVPNTVIQFDFLGVNIAMSHAMVYATILMLIGMALIMVAWVTLYRNIKEDEIVTKGIYSYSRHPQYLGFILMIIGWLVGWPTILTVILGPILIVIYVRVSVIEERELGGSDEYRRYKERVPFFV
jgi:protein-S-isoprenylcysteine O-methyltransferase Ste14